MAAHQTPLSLGFSRQEHWSGLPFPSPMHESEMWKWSHSVVSDSSDSMDCSLSGSSIYGIFQARVLEWGAIAFSGYWNMFLYKFDYVIHHFNVHFFLLLTKGSLLAHLMNAYWRRKWQPTPVLLPGKSHRWRSVVGYSPWGCKESDTTERLHFFFFYDMTHLC